MSIKSKLPLYDPAPEELEQLSCYSALLPDGFRQIRKGNPQRMIYELMIANNSD